MSEFEIDPLIREREKIAAAKKTLNVERFVLQIHNASFPAEADEDLGRGTPYSRGAERFFEFAARLGFDAIQLGPRGMTDAGNPSPYDATLFSRNPLDLPLKRYVDQGRLSRATWESIRRSLPQAVQGVVPYPLVFGACQLALREIAANASTEDRTRAREFLEANRTWLIPDALYGVLSREYGNVPWFDWEKTEQGLIDQRLFDPLPGQEQVAAARIAVLRQQFAGEMEDYALIQSLLDEESRALRRRLAGLGLALFGDLQVGLSHQDFWAWRSLFLRDYLMGAPPSRTNPQGQPWGYALLDPEQFGTSEKPGPSLIFVRERIRRLLAECDGLRIDHPHGWIDPWTYRADDVDPFHAVQTGARLFSSPADRQHPQLARYAIARPEQIDPQVPLYGDGHVNILDDEQTARYSILVDEIIAQQGLAGRATGSIACEVLSTLPYPVSRVMARHGLGRFRVVQKLDLANAADVYRIENAAPADWIMLGTHDTPPIWQLADAWRQTETGTAWGRYLAGLLASPAERDAVERDVAASSGRLINACFAAMLASRAQQVVVFFPDLLGMTQRYNEPGVVSTANWSLRVPAEFDAFYAKQLRTGQALDLEAAFALAERAQRGG